MAQNPPVDTRSSGSVLRDIYGALTKVFGGLWTRYGGWGWSRIRLFLPGARFDWEREAADLWMNSVVALGIAWLGNRLPRPKLQLCKIARNGDLQPIGRSALVDLWSRPNPFYDRRTLEKACGLSLIVDGNAYIYKVRDRMGRVCQLWWIPQYRCLPTWPGDGSKYIDGYRVWLDTAVYHLPPEDVLHIRDGIDPRNERLGLSPLRACIREVCTINNEASFTAGLLKNSGVPGLMIVPDQQGNVPVRPDAAGAERLKERIRDSFQGDNTGDAVVLAGSYKVVPVGFTPEQMALDKLPQASQARIAAAVGVAAMSLGLPDPGKTYSNLGEANRTSWGTIVAMQELIAEAIRMDLLLENIQGNGVDAKPVDPLDFVVRYDYSHIQELQESLDSLHKRVRDDFAADLITKNEAREETGRDPDPDGDVYYSEIKAAAAPKIPGDEEPPALPPPDKSLALANGNGHAARWSY